MRAVWYNCSLDYTSKFNLNFPALNVHRLLRGARQPTDVTAWCLSAKNEADAEPEMPLGRAIIFLNAPVKHEKCTCLVGAAAAAAWIQSWWSWGDSSRRGITRCRKAWRWCFREEAWRPSCAPPLPLSTHHMYSIHTCRSTHAHTKTHKRSRPVLICVDKEPSSRSTSNDSHSLHRATDNI